jgi:hypothetical protein
MFFARGQKGKKKYYGYIVSHKITANVFGLGEGGDFYHKC